MEIKSALLFLLAIVSDTVSADPDLLQDICVADLSSGITKPIKKKISSDQLVLICILLIFLGVKLNGYPCKESTKVTASDFFFNGLAKPGSTNNSMGSVVTPANVQKIPGLNTLGVSLSRVDYAPNGLNPPHTHPRATEMVFVLEGQLDVGFVTTSNILISKTIKKGEVFVFPKGLVHYQKNNGATAAAAIAAFNSQLPGTQSLAATLFSATPSVPDNVLTKAFQVGTKEIEKIKERLAPPPKN
ncbi:hypothetical protein GIB67_029315 [Kingdonia uniflora]|uniref:Germin-like protein n=1 Tax=Kingdonia uniflora TaxID=39325 RepID=A0A7J7N8L4_9MAGN|nr:hypothetical protein GIB67_029315 [Kingdonia uniflora]